MHSESPISELGNLEPSKLPTPDATTAEKREIAAQLTIQDAIDYQLLTDLFADESPYDYVYSTLDGTITYYESYGDGEDLDYEHTDIIIGFDYTTLGELYNHTN